MKMSLQEQASILSREVLISVRIVSMDYYMAPPSTEADNLLDPVYSMFRSAPIKRVPILRVFGSTPAGQKACLHIHGIFPYLYIPMPAGDNPGFLYRLASSLDKAINMTMSGNAAAAAEKETKLESNPNYHHVFKIIEVSGMPYYGYHSREHRFAKVYLYNPMYLKRASDLLNSGAVMGQVFQPHYSHVPYTLQFMMDYNLQGMSLIHLKMAKFRHDQPAALICEDSSQQISVDWLSLTPASQKVFKLKEMTIDMLAPDTLKRTTTCQLELDAVAADVLNTNEDLVDTKAKRSGNPGLEFIWEDEKLRRLHQGLSLEENPLTPPSSPPRQRSPNTKTDSEQFWETRFNCILDEWRESGILDETIAGNESINADLEATVLVDDKGKKTAFYPEETLNTTELQSATFIEKHIASLSISESQRSKTSFSDAAVANDKMENSQDLFEDTVIDEEAISQFINNTLEEENSEKKAAAADQSGLYLESDDDELVELLLDLQCEGTNTREEVLSQVKSKDEKYQQEVDDTLEMTQIWNDDDFDKFIANTEAAAENQLDDDTFWEEEFDSDDVLD